MKVLPPGNPWHLELFNPIPFRFSNLMLNLESMIHAAPEMATVSKESKLHVKFGSVRPTNQI